ncbi:protein of unknown function (plasmid) [Thermococcus nautili]|nr:protein of unknown function [Thermococcus nautili]
MAFLMFLTFKGKKIGGVENVYACKNVCPDTVNAEAEVCIRDCGKWTRKNLLHTNTRPTSLWKEENTLRPIPGRRFWAGL